MLCLLTCLFEVTFPPPIWTLLCRFLMDLENRVEQSIQISDVCDIVYEHAVQHFHVFINYVINQGYQEKHYRRILWVHPGLGESCCKTASRKEKKRNNFVR